ncbi:MAG: DNA polymerase III subunit gamma/tau, partial [Gordonia sp. (in: high G+C Gram-positive bacteria)]
APAQQPRSSGAAEAPGQQPARRPVYTRPSRAHGAPPPDDGYDAPPPPEPDEPAPPVPDEELTDAERDEMIAQAQNGTPDHRLDPDQVALELLKSELGARPIE